MSYELAEKYQAFKADQLYAGTSNFYRMMFFAQKNNLTNDDMDYYFNRPGRRQEDETKEEMQLRGKFTKALVKYRAYLYDYSVYENN
jgi:hypothetical protein